MISERLRFVTRDLVAGVATVVAKTGVTPNMLTWLGFWMSAFTGWILARGDLRLGGLLILVAGIFDALDGSVARVTNRVSTFGAFLDSTLDRLSEAWLYLGLLVYFVQPPSNQEGVILAYLAIVGSLMVSYTRARAEGAGLECKVGLFTRLERVVVLALGLMLGQIRIALWLIVIGSFLTAFHRMWYVWKQSMSS